MTTNYKIGIGSSLFNKPYKDLLDVTQRTQIFFGGASAGKSVFLAQRDIRDLLVGGRNFLVCREVARTIKTSVFNEAVKAIEMYGMEEFFKINNTSFTITCYNGYQMLFGGLDEPKKVKSMTPQKGVLTDIRVEEATDIKESAFKELKKRLRGLDKGESLPKRIVLSFNPILQNHWIYSRFFKGIWTNEMREYTNKDLLIRRFTYRDNKFLAPDDIAELEKESDKYSFDVYTEGYWGVLGDTIFTNWEIQDLSGLQDKFDTYYNGLDFGFSNPSAFVRCAINDDKKEIYILKEALGVGMTNAEIAAEIGSLVGKDEVVWCDSAEPKSIYELRLHGINAMPVKKGKDSVQYSIQWLQGYKVIIDQKCTNTITEVQLYHYEEDRYGQKRLTPAKVNDHFIDAFRYSTEEIREFLSYGEFKIYRLG